MRRGFSLAELAVVLAILGVVTAVTLPRLWGWLDWGARAGLAALRSLARPSPARRGARSLESRGRLHPHRARLGPLEHPRGAAARASRRHHYGVAGGQSETLVTPVQPIRGAARLIDRTEGGGAAEVKPSGLGPVQQTDNGRGRSVTATSPDRQPGELSAPGLVFLTGIASALPEPCPARRPVQRRAPRRCRGPTRQVP